MLGRIAQVALTVSDLDRAVEFYEHKLGLPLLFRAPPGLAFFNASGTRLMLSVPEAEFRPGGGSVLYFLVDDIRAEHAAMAARGVAFRDEPHLIAKMPDHELWMTFLKDTEGNTLALMSEVR